MPNWCANTVVVKGDEEKVDAFEEFLKGGKGNFDFNLFIPYPEEYRVLDEKHSEAINKGLPWKDVPKKNGYNSGGYEWCIENWGTKWGACEVVTARMSPEVFYADFDTAWSPPIPVVQKASEMFDSLTFSISYSEEAMGFEGRSEFLSGEIVNEYCTEYSFQRADED